MTNEDYLVGMNLLNVAIQTQIQLSTIRSILCPCYDSLTESQQMEFDKEIMELKEKYSKIYEQKREEEYQKWSAYYDRKIKELYGEGGRYAKYEPTKDKNK